MSTAIVDGNAVPDETQPSLCSRRPVDGNILFRRHVDGKGVKMSPGEASIVLVYAVMKKDIVTYIFVSVNIFITH
jgi:hypothetical protein